MDFIFSPSTISSIPIIGQTQRFPVHRIYCIGRNYADHVKEMGAEVNRETPIFFCKPADAVVTDGQNVPYPPATNNLHHEVEMVVALKSGGTRIEIADALAHIYGYAVGLDLTRRDLQATAKSKGLPWDTGKAFDFSAPISVIYAAYEIGHPTDAILSLEVNGELRQKTNISEMIFSIPEIIHELSKLFMLQKGDLIFTGTPAGVSELKRGDKFVAKLKGIAECKGKIV